MDNMLLVFGIVGFLAVVFLLEGVYGVWRSSRGQEAQRLKRRLQALAAGGELSFDSGLVKERLLSATPAVERLLQSFPRVQQLDRMLLQSGLNLTVSRFMGLTASAAAAGLAIWIALPVPLVFAPLFACAMGVLPGLYVMHRRRRRLRAIEQQLPDALELMARALRAGHAFLSAMQMVGTEGPEPIAGEFRYAFDEVNYGVTMQDALVNLSHRVPIADLRFFVIAVAVQRETGGNLAELLDKLGALVRARFRLQGTIRVLSAEGRLSGWILTLLPFLLLAAIHAINARFMSILWRDPIGVAAMWIGGFLMVVGIFWMWRVVKIRV